MFKNIFEFDWFGSIMVFMLGVMFTITFLWPYTVFKPKTKIYMDCFGEYEHCVETSYKTFPEDIKVIINWK